MAARRVRVPAHAADSAHREYALTLLAHCLVSVPARSYSNRTGEISLCGGPFQPDSIAAERDTIAAERDALKTRLGCVEQQLAAVYHNGAVAEGATGDAIGRRQGHRRAALGQSGQSLGAGTAQQCMVARTRGNIIRPNDRLSGARGPNVMAGLVPAISGQFRDIGDRGRAVILSGSWYNSRYQPHRLRRTDRWSSCRLSSADGLAMADSLRPRRALSVGCGVASKEMDALAACVVDTFDCYDVSANAIRAGQELAVARRVPERIMLHHGDPFTFEIKHDVGLVYWNNALHHMTLAPRLNGVGTIFATAVSLQWTIMSAIPACNIRRSWWHGVLVCWACFPSICAATGTVWILPAVIGVVPAEDMARVYPSECADSGSILSSVQSILPNAQIIKTGGAANAHCAL